MLYHVPDPGRAIGELARVLRPSGILIAAANGRRNLAELWAIRAKVFEVSPIPETTERFGRESGEQLLGSRFGGVTWRDYPDELVCTDIADVMAFLTSSPPGEDASAVQRAHLEDELRARFDADGGTLRVSKETGLFLCREPLRQDAAIPSRC
jgi:SAM-dependent methyltransferase